MRKLAIREVETLKTTAAPYCPDCCEPPPIIWTA